MFPVAIGVVLVAVLFALGGGSPAEGTGTGAGGKPGDKTPDDKKTPGAPPDTSKPTTYVVQKGDTEIGIAHKFGQPDHNYTQLHDANPSKPTTNSYEDTATKRWYTSDEPPSSIPGYNSSTGCGSNFQCYRGKVFKTLTVGEVLNIPASWGTKI